MMQIDPWVANGPNYTSFNLTNNGGQNLPSFGSFSYGYNLSNGLVEIDIINNSDISVYSNTGFSFVQKLSSTTSRFLLNVKGNGDVLAVSGTGGLGYGTGAGGTVTQTGSRTAGVAINKPCGRIQLVSAAGTTTWQAFTVTNSLASQNDTVIVSVSSATNFYVATVPSVQNGNFQVGFSAVSGTASDAPYINFAIIKGATS